jgi:hypothetical protein
MKLRTDAALNTPENKKGKDNKIKNISSSPVVGEGEGEMSVVDGNDDVKGKKESALGIVDYDSETEKNEEMVLSEIEKEDTVTDENSPETVELREKYGFYKTFWGLQSYMSCENAKRFVDAPIAAATASNTGNIIIIIIIKNHRLHYEKCSLEYGCTNTYNQSCDNFSFPCFSFYLFYNQNENSAIELQKKEWADLVNHANAVLKSFEDGKT